MQDACKSNLGHRLLYGIDEYFNPHQTMPEGFFYNIARGLNLDEKMHGDDDKDGIYIRYILNFLKRGGKFEVAEVIRNGDEIDCSRFFLKVLSIRNNK